MLGGAEGNTLFLSMVRTCEGVKCKALGEAAGHIEAVEVAVGAATSRSANYWAGYC